MSLPSPARTLAIALALAGGAIVLANAVDPDESRALGALVGISGAALAVLRETRRRAAIAQMLAVTLLVLAGGELAVRHENAASQRAFADNLIHFVDDPLLRYEMKPSTGCGEGTTNELGMLDRARAFAKAEGTVRVACLGDSVGGDCSLPADNTCAALERVLVTTRGGRPAEVLNFSVPGYNTMQEARALEVRAMRFSPDAVVVLYVVNDPFPDLAVSHFLPGHFKFEHLLWNGAQLAASRAIDARLDPVSRGLAQLYETPRAWEGVVVAGFDRIRAAAGARPVVVAIFPVFLERPSPLYAPLYAKVAREAERHGFVALDLAQVAYAGIPVAELLKPSRDMIHPNAHAHALAADAIARALVAAAPEWTRP